MPRKGGGNMSFPISGFVPVPSAETMQIISIAALFAGICLVGAGTLLLFLNKKKGEEKKAAVLWIFIGVGVLLIVNHGIQLLF